eukprot:4892757-Amphidinium_carterae.3
MAKLCEDEMHPRSAQARGIKWATWQFQETLRWSAASSTLLLLVTCNNNDLEVACFTLRDGSSIHLSYHIGNGLDSEQRLPAMVRHFLACDVFGCSAGGASSPQWHGGKWSILFLGRVCLLEIASQSLLARDMHCWSEPKCLMESIMCLDVFMSAEKETWNKLWPKAIPTTEASECIAQR